MPNQVSNGYLIVRTTASGGAVPVENSHVAVMSSATDSELLYQLTTDNSGLTQPVALPAPAIAESVSPGQPTPFYEYTVQITHPDYEQVVVTGVQMFPGITAVLPVNMLPARPRETEPRQVYDGSKQLPLSDGEEVK